MAPILDNIRNGRVAQLGQGGGILGFGIIDRVKQAVSNVQSQVQSRPRLFR